MRLTRASILSALLLAGACSRGSARDETPAAPTPAAPTRLAEPTRTRHAGEVVASGTLKAAQSAALAPSVPGTLRRVAVRRGQLVAEGAVLVELESDAARAGLAQAEAGLGAAEAQLRLAEDALRRTAEIQKNDGGLSPQQVVQVEAQRDLASAQAQGARAQKVQAEVALRHHTLRAPFAGLVTRVPDGVGMRVAPAVPLVSLESVRTLVLETSLTQEEAAEVKAGAAVEVWVPASGARTAAAKVSLVLPSVDAATARVPVEVAVPNADGRFLPHAFARARFPAGPPRDAWKIPAAAITQREGRFAAWVAAADGKARLLPVRLLGQEGDAAVVDPGAGGWPEATRVVERPPLGIAEGMAVAEAR